MEINRKSIESMSTRPAQSPPVTLLGEFSKKLVTNTFFNLLGRSWSFLVTILLTPYLLEHLGKGEFGVWVLLSVFTISFNLLDLGLGSSFVRYISAYYTYEDYARINEVLFSGLAFYGLFGVVLTSVGIAVEKPLFAYFNITDARNVFPIVLIACSVQNVAVLFLSVFKGMQRMDVSNSLEIKISILNVCGTVIFLQRGFGILGLAINSLLIQLTTMVWTWWTVRRFMPKVRLGWHVNPRLLKEMFSYGAKIQVSQVGNLVCFNVDKLIISRFIGVAAVPFYEVGSRLTAIMRAIPLVMLSALIPATSELGARNDRERIRQTYYVTSKYVCMLTVALMAFMILEAQSVVNFWIGPGFENSAILIQILAIGYGVNVMGGAASQTGAGVGRPEFDMKSTVLLTVLNPILSILLVRQFGSAGAAAGTSIALVIAAIYLLIIFHREYLGNSVSTILRDVQLRPMIAAAAAAFAVVGFHSAIPQFAEAEHFRYLIPIKLVADVALFAPFYVAILVALRQVTSIDWNNFLSLAAFGFEFLRHPLRERVKIYR
jgi:O-antigen/teichoic acid export membrane protein